MRAIIIDDKDAKALLESLSLAKLLETARIPKENHIEQAALHEMHRMFHYRVCRWLQEQGANVV